MSRFVTWRYRMLYADLESVGRIAEHLGWAAATVRWKAYVGLTHPAVGESMEEEKSVLRWGGLAGVLAGILYILGFVILIVFVGPPPADPEGLVMRFPNVRAALATGQSLATVAGFLSIALLLALSRALRGTGPGLAHFGSLLGVLGLLVLALGVSSTFVAVAPLSDLYHAPGATPEEQATLVLLWQATQGITFTFHFVGNLFVMVSLIALGVAMLGAPAFGKGFGGVSVVLGGVGTVAVYTNLVILAAIGVAVLATIIFVPLLGWKVYTLSREA